MPLLISLNTVFQRIIQFNTLILEEVNRADSSIELVSGKGINVLRSLSRIENNSDFVKRNKLLACIGGSNEDFLLTQISKEGLPVIPVKIHAGTRTCTSLLAQGTSTELIEPSPELESNEFGALIQNLEKNWPEDEVFAFAGTSLNYKNRSFYSYLENHFSFSKSLVMVDCSGQHLIDLLRLDPQIIKINRFELGDLLGFRSHDLGKNQSKVQNLIYSFFENQSRLKWLLITLGQAGVLAVERTVNNFRWKYVKSPEIKPLNTIGSGDAFFAGLLFAFSNFVSNQIQTGSSTNEHWPDLDTVLITATSYATSNCLSLIPGDVVADEVEEFIALLRGTVHSYDELPPELL
jgi:fructose-1-phosphate kinase PfkB-like protein